MACLSGGAPHNSNRVLKSGAWTNETLASGINAIIDEGMGFKETSMVFGIPVSSIRDHLYGRTTSR